jgi:dTMP kinase
MNKFIVLEGLDGCGKSTQMDLICERLTKEDIAFKRIKLPNYGTPSADVVKQYLAGDFEGISPYASSLLYTTDRVAAYEGGWKKDYLNGKLIVADRYTQSNIIFQMTKLDKAEWDGYIEWLTNLEFTLCKLPAPDKVIFLDMPVEVSQKLMSQRYNGDEQKKDIHEANVEFLNACREAALYAAEKLGWVVISCAHDGEPLSIKEINNMVYEAVIS